MAHCLKLEDQGCFSAATWLKPALSKAHEEQQAAWKVLIEMLKDATSLQTASGRLSSQRSQSFGTPSTMPPLSNEIGQCDTATEADQTLKGTSGTEGSVKATIN